MRWLVSDDYSFVSFWWKKRIITCVQLLSCETAEFFVFFRNSISSSHLMPMSCRPPKWLPEGSWQHLKGYSVSQHYTEHRWKLTMPSSLVFPVLSVSSWYTDSVCKLWDLGIIHSSVRVCVCSNDKSFLQVDSAVSFINSEMGDAEQNEITSKIKHRKITNAVYK